MEQHPGMTFHDLHTRAILPMAFRVCGLDLMPLTIGQARILDALGLWGAVSPSELVLAAYVCSRPSVVTARAIHSRWTQLHLWWLRCRLGRKWDFARSAKVWLEFVSYSREEAFATFKTGSGTNEMPITARLRAVLCGRMGYRPETFDNVPYCQAILDHQALGEAEGFVNVTPCTVSEVRAAVEALRH